MPYAQCGFVNQPQAKFCGECGAALSPRARASTAPPLAPCLHAPLSYTPGYLADKIVSSTSALEGERKQVNVLYADLKGSMELLADRDPEEARHLLDPVLERMMAAVHRCDGTVNQVMGDGIMALFGAPVAYQDYAATRPGRCSFCARARLVSRPRRSSPPPATTDRPLPSLRRWAYARSRLTVTMASAPCMPSSASGSKRAQNCPPPSNSTAPWR